MRAAETPARLDTSTPNVVLMDSCGVANRPAFVALAEQQCRKAEREHLPIELLYARLSGTRWRGRHPPAATERCAAHLVRRPVRRGLRMG